MAARRLTKAQFVRRQVRRGQTSRQAEATWKMLRANAARHKRRLTPQQRAKRRKKRRALRAKRRREFERRWRREARLETRARVRLQRRAAERHLRQHLRNLRLRTGLPFVWWLGPSEVPSELPVSQPRFGAASRRRTRGDWSRWEWHLRRRGVVGQLIQLSLAPAERQGRLFRELAFDSGLDEPLASISSGGAAHQLLVPCLGHSHEARMRAAAAGCLGFWPGAEQTGCLTWPAQVRLDRQQRLHSEDGPAAVWPNGDELYAWHGVAVPERVIREPASLSAADVERARNVELRRALIERMGYERYLAEAEFERLGEDEYGILWGKAQWNAEALVFVEVHNSTPEPDGSARRYFLRVPPIVQTPREAVAWTFGMAAEDYAPSVET